MLVLNSPQVMQETALRWKRDSRVVLVPTMGALHDGHLQLVETAKRFGEKIVVSIFVNPLQFGPNEDFNRYPRPFDEDRARCEAASVDVLFAPDAKDFYPPGFGTRVALPDLARHMEGASRPGHFEGVATVCLKLFQATQADFAVFGEKDFQQLRLIRQMTEDLNLPLTIVANPTVREPDGLALSSRNRYLSSEDRAIAARIPQAIRRAQELTSKHGDVTVGDVTRAMKSILAAPLEIDYVAIADEKNLVPADEAQRIAELALPRVFVAVKAGKTRLIDNARLGTQS